MRASASRPSVYIRQWSAWAPGLSTPHHWKDFFKGKRPLAMNENPDVSAVPARLRRRMSRLSRMAAASAFECCRLAEVSPRHVRTVLASRHGEMDVTTRLLEQLQAHEPVSPMAFAGSVHHTALGYFSLASKNHETMRAVAGGEASFAYGFLDAMGMLSDRADAPVLLIAADDEIPVPFKTVGGPLPFPWAAAFLIDRCGPVRQRSLSLEITGLRPASATPKAAGTPALEFLRWFLGREKKFIQVLGRRIWRWQR